MERTYVYEPSKYRFKIVYMGYALIGFGIWMLINWLRDPGINLFLFGLAAAIYGILNNFLFKTNPGIITIDDEKITFDVNGSKRTFVINELKDFNLREQGNAQFYLRLTDGAGKFYRYWISYYYFSEQKDFINEMYHIEMRVRPEGIKFRGRQNQFKYRPGQEPEGWFLEVDEDED